MPLNFSCRSCDNININYILYVASVRKNSKNDRNEFTKYFSNFETFVFWQVVVFPLTRGQEMGHTLELKWILNCTLRMSPFSFYFWSKSNKSLIFHNFIAIKTLNEQNKYIVTINTKDDILWMPSWFLNNEHDC